MTKKNMTRKEIAAMAGVSVSVVSRALNNSGYVAADKKARILRLAEDNGYVPHPVAMSLQQQRTGQVLFFCKDLHNSFNIDLYYSMVNAARERGYMALINANVTFEDIRGMMVDGIILQNEFFVRKYAESYGKTYHLPAVGVSYGNLETLPASIPVVEWDLGAGMEQAIHYLRDRGHTRIAYAAPYNFESSNARSIAWKNQMGPVLGNRLERYYLDTSTDSPDGLMIADYEDPKEWKNEEIYHSKGRKAIELFLERQLDATAIIAFNDEFAMGMMQTLHSCGIRVPEELSIISFDGSYRSTTSAPSLVSIGPDYRQCGEMVVNTLLDRVEGKRIHYFARVRGYLREGDSVRALR